MEKYSKSKTSLFLMEMILTILMFSICGAICMKLFAVSNSLMKETKELNSSVSCAQGFVEVMRGTDGSIEEIVELYPNAVKSGDYLFEIFYDKDFNECDFSEAEYVGDVVLTPEGAIQNIDVKIIRLEDNKEIYTLSATKYMGKSKG